MTGYFALGSVDRKVTVVLDEEALSISVEGFGMWNSQRKIYEEMPIFKVFHGETLFFEFVKDLNDEWDYVYDQLEFSSLELPEIGQFKVQWQWETQEGVCCTFSRWLDLPSIDQINDMTLKNEIIAQSVLYEWDTIIPKDELHSCQIVAYRMNGKEVWASDTRRASLNCMEIAHDMKGLMK